MIGFGKKEKNFLVNSLLLPFGSILNVRDRFSFVVTGKKQTRSEFIIVLQVFGIQTQKLGKQRVCLCVFFLVKKSVSLLFHIILRGENILGKSVRSRE